MKTDKQKEVWIVKDKNIISKWDSFIYLQSESIGSILLKKKIVPDISSDDRGIEQELNIKQRGRD